MYTLTMFALNALKKDKTIEYLKEQVQEQGFEVVSRDLFRTSYVTAYNLNVKFHPDLIMTVEEYDTYFTEAFGLASQRSAS